jgi:hypothetical protein
MMSYYDVACSYYIRGGVYDVWGCVRWILMERAGCYNTTMFNVMMSRSRIKTSSRSIGDTTAAGCSH